jgi:SAM-dependent methyltransferase
MTDPRSVARKLATEALAAGKPLDWFEILYSRATTDGVSIPWADRRPNPNLIELFEKVKHLPFGKRAIKVGCGLGDDAEWLARQGFDVTAFDISPSAIHECHLRFPSSSVHYVEMDLFKAPPQWTSAFDLVQESYTLQVLPPELWAAAMAKISEFIAPGGYLLFVTRARDESDPKGAMPWPLTRREVDRFIALGLECVYFEDYSDGETPPVRRFRACYQRKPA